MAANRRVLSYFEAPAYRQTVVENYHRNVGDYNPPKSNWHIVANYPDRRNLSFLVGPTPRIWQEFTQPRDRKMLKRVVPNGEIITNKYPSNPIDTTKYTLPRRMYIYNGQVVVQ